MPALLALLLALAPEPQTSEADDFNAMVKKAEVAFECEGVSLKRDDEDEIRLVSFCCPEGQGFDLLFVRAEAGDWYVITRRLRSAAEMPKGSDI